MKASHNLAAVTTTFDEDNLVSNAGLVAPALLAQRLGIAGLVDAHVRLDGEAAANSGAKALTVVGSALAGGDSIDDCDVLRAGAAGEVFDGVRAPSTVGTWLRSFAWAGVRSSTVSRAGCCAAPGPRGWSGPGCRRRVDGGHRLDGV